MHTSDPLSPTPRTSLTRARERARSDRRDLVDVLDSSHICHFGVVVDGSPRVMPTAFGVDYDGPDAGGTLYLHGSVAARSLVAGGRSDICVTVTSLDGLVLARSAFHHSMNYRSAVIHGRARVVQDDTEKRRALDAIVEHIVPGRTAHLRPTTKKELAATVVLALPLYEASVKARDGGPIDDAADIEIGGVWAGVVPVTRGMGPATTALDVASDIEVPVHVADLQI